MIHITDKSKCCGCHACVQCCPKQCITMHEDEEGFLYPLVDESLCVECGLCEKICPIINKNESLAYLSCYAAINPNTECRYNSTSGGIFPMLAEKIIVDGGVVFGARWNQEWKVTHSYVEKKEDIIYLQGSKYVQSYIGNSYIDAERFLKSGVKVLFSGTPCQIAGLKKFLRKEYNNLLCVDFICHGVPSPGVFRWYLQEELNKLLNINKKNTAIPMKLSIPNEYVITDIQFRNKKNGWKDYSFKLSVNQKSGKKITVFHSLHNHPYLVGFSNNYYLRPSCHKCEFKNLKSGADITIADFWGFKDKKTIKDDDKGISAIIVSTQKGDEYLKSTNAILEEVSYNEIVSTNGALLHSAQAPYREYFYSHKNSSFKDIISKITSTKLRYKILRRIYLKTHKHEYYQK